MRSLSHRIAREASFWLMLAVALPLTALFGGVGAFCEWRDRRRGIYL